MTKSLILTPSSSCSKAHTWPSIIQHRIARYLTTTLSRTSASTLDSTHTSTSAPTTRHLTSALLCSLSPRTRREALPTARPPPTSTPPLSLSPPSSGWPFDTWDWFNVEEKKKPSPVSRHRLPPFLDGRWCLSVPRSRPVFLSTTVAAPATDSSRLAHHHLAAHPLPHSGHSLAQPLSRRQLARFQYHV